MNGAVTEDRGEREQLKQAILAYQSALTSTVSSLVRPPVRPVRMVLDKKGLEASLQPVRVAQEEVVRRFASASGVDEQTAKPTVRRLLKEVSVLALIGWDKTADVATAKRPTPQV